MSPQASLGIDKDNKEEAVSILLSEKRSRLVTPTTTTRSMDSDDDFMTDVSSREEDFLDMQDSEDESLGEGQFFLSLFGRLLSFILHDTRLR